MSPLSHDEKARVSPDVTVVVIVYNDAPHLPRAVQSVLDQSLDNLEVVIVDDASTDATSQVTQRLARHPKVRSIRLPHNSGGCSRPRNVGIENATGEYVMFLDSDDVLDRNACRNLLLAAEETGADFSAGLCVRDHVNKNKTTRWYAWLYSARSVYTSVRENPDLLYDTLSTNKCYRRSFLNEQDLRFPEGLHYEDLVFSARCYLAATKFVLIPNVVYRWQVVDAADNPSITNRRYEFRNFSDRIRVHRLIDDMLVRRGYTELKQHKDIKFLRHDIRIYLNDFPYRDADFQARFLDLAAEYLRTLTPAAFELAGPLPRIAAFMILRRDVPGLSTAIDYLNHGYKLSTDLVVSDGRVYWLDRYLDTEEGRRTLEVTELGLHELSHDALHFYDLLTDVTVDGPRITLRGEITNQLGRIPADGFSLALAFRSRRTKGSHKLLPVTDVEHLGDRVRWSATVDLRGVVKPLGIIDPIWDVAMRLRVDGVDNFSPLSIDRARFEGFHIPVRTRLGSVGGDHFDTFITLNGNLALRLVTHSRTGRAIRTAGARALASGPGRRARRQAGRVVRGTRRLRDDSAFKKEVYSRLLVRLPIRKGTVVFESHLGKHYSDNPRFIYEELRRRGLPYQAIWSYAGSPAGFPAEATVVKRYGWSHLVALARAEFWVDNQGMPVIARKREGTTYLQTWHGTALKRMGHDLPAMKRASGAQRLALQQQVNRWDAFLVRCEHDTETLVPAYRFQGEVLRYGYPRNDLLVNLDDAGREELRRRLNLPAGRRIVLYAPTYREDYQSGHRAFELPIDLDRLRERLGDSCHLLVRTHYLDRFTLAPGYGPLARNVSGLHDIAELLACADVLVTDYSSVMFDFAVTGRPMIFYTYDYEQYTKHDRGAYFELSEVAPGPLVSTQDELFDALADPAAWAAQYADRYERFVKRFAEYDDGHAAERVVDRFFAPGGGA